MSFGVFVLHLLKLGSSPLLVYCNACSTGVGPVCFVGPALLLSSVCFLRHVQLLEQLHLARCWQSACWAQPCSAWAEPGEAGSRTGRLPWPALCLLSSREQFHILGRLGCGSRSSPSLPWVQPDAPEESLLTCARPSGTALAVELGGLQHD